MKARISLPVLFSLFVISFILPSQALAQGADPPRCCDAIAPVEETSSSTDLNRIVISDESLAAMGITRTEYVDRLIAGFISGKEIYLVFALVRIVDPSLVSAEPVGGVMPEMVKVTQQYRVPRSQITTEQIEALDLLQITDGIISIEVSFKSVEIVAVAQ